MNCSYFKKAIRRQALTINKKPMKINIILFISFALTMLFGEVMEAKNQANTLVGKASNIESL